MSIFKRKFVQVEIYKDVYGQGKWDYINFTNDGKLKSKLKVLRDWLNNKEVEAHGVVRFYIKEVYKTDNPQGDFKNIIL